MKKQTFVRTIQALKNLIEDTREQDLKFEEAFGHESTVINQVCDPLYDSMIDIISEDMCSDMYSKEEVQENIEWLLFEEGNFSIDGIDYEGSPENIWYSLKDKLNIEHSIPSQESEQEQKLDQEPKSDTGPKIKAEQIEFDFSDLLELFNKLSKV